MSGASHILFLALLLSLYLGLGSAAMILPTGNDVPLAQPGPHLPADLFEPYPESDPEQDSESSPMNCDANGNFIGSCTFDLRARCGSDGVTYMGGCEVANAQCKNPHLFIVVSGPCHDYYDVCELPAEGGICKAYMPRFYFNSKSGKCEEFIYGGCQGNDNNFRTIQACIANCDKPKAATPELCSGFQCVSTGVCIPSSWKCDGDNDCDDNSDESNCTCTSFQCDNGQCIDSYWECDGDNDCGDNSDESNCFPQCEEGSRWTEECNSCLCSNGQADCTEKFCAPEPDVCQLPADGGICEAYIQSYYFNSKSGKCEAFIYGGCQGNDNNFKTIQECIEKCDKPNSATPEPCSGFQCIFNGQCIDFSWMCDGYNDCGDNSDESNCYMASLNAKMLAPMIPPQHNNCKYPVGDEMRIGTYNEKCDKCENCDKCHVFNPKTCKCNKNPFCKP